MFAAAFAAFLHSCGGGDAAAVHAPTPRPVTVIPTAVARPATGGWMVGVARPYREDQLAFEVAGRVKVVEDLGAELRGPTLDDDDRVVPGSEGEPIARIETTRYDQALRSAELALASAQKGLAGQRIRAEMAATSELQQAEAALRVAEQELAAAESSERTAKARLQRTREQFEGQIASQAQLDADQNAWDGAAAALESARLARLSANSGLAAAQSRAQLEAAAVEQSLAQLAELEQRVRNAQQDLLDCTLRAPFSGRITAVHAGRGGVIQPGSPIVTLTAMNPMQVSVTVGAEDSRRLVQGQQVALRPRELGLYTDAEVLYGVVFGKPEVADAATRTYRVDVMVRNLRRSRTPAAAAGAVHAVEGFMPVMHAEAGGQGPLFVGSDCVRDEAGSKVVYRLPGMAGFSPRQQPIDAVMRPERIEVELRPERLTFVNFKFVAIAGGSPLAEGDTLIREPRPEYVDGVALQRHDWAIRPGDLVPVRLAAAELPMGVWVPVDAISSLNGRQSVFVVDGGRCRRVPVTVHESAGDLRRIDGDGIDAGLQLVREGAHYLADGDAVAVVDSIFGERR